MTKTLIDLNSFVAVESLFRLGKKDPWAYKLLGALCDAFIYSDRIRYPFPLPNLPYNESREPLLPNLLNLLSSRDPGLLIAIEYPTANQLQVNDIVAINGIKLFADWIIPNKRSFSQWCMLHKENWVAELVTSELAHKYIYSLDSLETDNYIEKLSQALEIPVSAILYAYDSLLRFPLYGAMAESDECYINHPLRSCIKIPTLTYSTVENSKKALTFSRLINELVNKKISIEDFTILMHELRGEVRKRNIHRVGPGDFDPETIREIFSKLKIPAKLRQFTNSNLTFDAAKMASQEEVTGILIKIAGNLWRKPLPRWVSGVSWLQWAIEWPEEKIGEQRLRE